MIELNGCYTEHNQKNQTPEIIEIIKQQMAKNIGDQLKNLGLMTFEERNYHHGVLVTKDKLYEESIVYSNLYATNRKTMLKINSLIKTLQMSLNGTDLEVLQKLHETIFKNTEIIF